jgi:hypothetical protein
MDAVSAITAIADALDVDGAEKSLQSTALETAVIIERGGRGGDEQGRSDVTVAALLDVSLEQQAQQFAASAALLLLDAVQRKGESLLLGEPGFQRSEMLTGVVGGSGWGQPRWSGESVEGVRHDLTVTIQQEHGQPNTL